MYTLVTKDLYNFFFRNAPEIEARISLPQVISLAKQLLDTLSKFKGDSVLNSESKLQEYLPVILKLKGEYFEQGTDGILNKIGNSVLKVQTIVQKTKQITSEIDVDVTSCVKGKEEELRSLGTNMVNNFTTTASEVINNVIKNIESNITNITAIRDEISNLPGKLSSDLLTWNPMPVVNKFIVHVKELIAKLPEQLEKIMTDASELIANLPKELLICVTSSIEQAEKDANDLVLNIAQDIGKKFGDAVIDYLLK